MLILGNINRFSLKRKKKGNINRLLMSQVYLVEAIELIKSIYLVAALLDASWGKEKSKNIIWVIKGHKYSVLFTDSLKCPKILLFTIIL